MSQVEDRDVSVCRRAMDVLLQKIKLNVWVRRWLQIIWWTKEGRHCI